MDQFTVSTEKINKYLISMESCIDLIKNEPDESTFLESMFNILQDAGYLLFHGYSFRADFVNRIKKLFLLIKNSPNVKVPPVVDFNYLDRSLDWYGKLWKNHREFVIDSPTLERESIVDQAWEKVTCELRGNAMELLTTGLDLQATLYAKEYLFTEIQNAEIWQKEWNAFEQQSQRYLSTIINSLKLEPFYYTSDLVFDLISGFEEPHPKEFLQFLRKIAGGFKDYAKYNGYRLIIGHQESAEIFHWVLSKYDESTQQMTKNYMRESAMAEYVIKKFIMHRCFIDTELPTLSKISNWELKSNLDKDNVTGIPLIKVGDSSYYVAVIPDGMKGFSIRTDFLQDDDHDLNGVVFCSIKELPSGENRVRFDNYIEKSRYLNLIKKTPPLSDSPHVTKLAFNDVCNPDMRELFIEQTAKELLSSISEQDSLDRDRQVVEINFREPENKSVKESEISIRETLSSNNIVQLSDFYTSDNDPVSLAARTDDLNEYHAPSRKQISFKISEGDATYTLPAGDKQGILKIENLRPNQPRTLTILDEKNVEIDKWEKIEVRGDGELLKEDITIPLSYFIRLD